jgi:brefeldin A-resistance guanine nucleotide exchange factor 1
MLLVMSNGGYLAPPDEQPEREELWNETWKRVNRFLPNFFAELFPEEAKKPRKVVKEEKVVKGKENEQQQVPPEEKAPAPAPALTKEEEDAKQDE